ncbi:hypothetical protein ABKV19_022188 [Rosa sericea]
MAVIDSIPQSTPGPLLSSSACCSSTSDLEDGIQEVIYFVKSFPIIIEANVYRDWSIVKSALGEHDINCHLDMVNSRMTFSTTRTKEPEIARKARHLLQLLSRNVPASSAVNIIKVPNCECEIIFTGLSKVNNSYLKELEGQTSCHIFSRDGYVRDGVVFDGFVIAIGPLEGLTIVRKAVECCSKMHPAYNTVTTMLATKKLNDLRL